MKSKLMAGTDSKPYLPGATPFATVEISQLGLVRSRQTPIEMKISDFTTIISP